MPTISFVNLTCDRGKRHSSFTTACRTKVSLDDHGDARTFKETIADHALLVEDRAVHFTRGKELIFLPRHASTNNQISDDERAAQDAEDYQLWRHDLVWAI